MEYVYATLTLYENGQEINEQNLTAVLEAAGSDVVASRIKAIVAALEDVDLDELGAEAGIEPAPSVGASSDGDESVAADVGDADAVDVADDAGDGSADADATDDASQDGGTAEVEEAAADAVAADVLDAGPSPEEGDAATEESAASTSEAEDG